MTRTDSTFWPAGANKPPLPARLCPTQPQHHRCRTRHHGSCHSGTGTDGPEHRRPYRSTARPCCRHSKAIWQAQGQAAASTGGVPSASRPGRQDSICEQPQPTRTMAPPAVTSQEDATNGNGPKVGVDLCAGRAASAWACLTRAASVAPFYQRWDGSKTAPDPPAAQKRKPSSVPADKISRPYRA